MFGVLMVTFDGTWRGYAEEVGVDILDTTTLAGRWNGEGYLGRQRLVSVQLFGVVSDEEYQI